MRTDKYGYTGQNNKKCPVCGSRVRIGPPVIYLKGDKKIGQHKWCVTCFNVVTRLLAAASDEEQIKQLILPSLTTYAYKALGSHNVPDDHVVKGFQLMTVKGQGLTLIMEFKHEF